MSIRNYIAEEVLFSEGFVDVTNDELIHKAGLMRCEKLRPMTVVDMASYFNTTPYRVRQFLKSRGIILQDGRLPVKDVLKIDFSPLLDLYLKGDGKRKSIAHFNAKDY